MPKSVIIVQRKGGGYVKDAKVTIEFPFLHHPLSAGFSKACYTNKDGEAVIEHSNTGRANIYVNGKDVDSFDAPDEKIIFI